MKIRWVVSVTALLFASLAGGLAQNVWQPTFKRGVNITDWVINGSVTTRADDLEWIARHGYDHVR